MKTLRLKSLLAAFACLISSCLGNPVDRLKLWMTYDEVATILPTETAYSFNPMAEEYATTTEERKLTIFYGLPLVDEYGVDLGFNADKELILINRVERATELPEHIRAQMLHSPDLMRLGEEFRVGPGRGREEAWRALQSLIEVQIADKTVVERGPFIQRILGKPDGAGLNGYRRKHEESDPAGERAKNDDSRLTYLLNTHEWGHEVLIIDCTAKDEQDFATKENIPFLPKSINKEEAELAESLGACLVNLGLGRLDCSAKEGFSVSLDSEQADAATLKKVAQLKALVSLSVTGPKFDDESLRLFEGHRYLASIRLTNTAITAKGLGVLDSLRDLKWVTISPPTFSEEEMETIRDTVPRCSFELGE